MQKASNCKQFSNLKVDRRWSVHSRENRNDILPCMPKRRRVSIILDDAISLLEWSHPTTVHLIDQYISADTQDNRRTTHRAEPFGASLQQAQQEETEDNLAQIAPWL